MNCCLVDNPTIHHPVFSEGLPTSNAGRGFSHQCCAYFSANYKRMRITIHAYNCTVKDSSTREKAGSIRIVHVS